jgi:hypothetical protein
MKLHQIILLGFIGFVTMACGGLTGESNYTPQMSLYSAPVKNTKDTLTIRAVTNDDYDYLMDTIAVGDTVQFKFVLNAVSNNLVSFNMIQSDTISSKIILPLESSLNEVFVKASSDYSAGKFTFVSKQNYVYFPFKYFAKAASTTSILKISLQSDANFGLSSGSNYVSFRLKTPIVAKKVN